MRFKVASAHKRSYPDPIEIKAGDILVLDGRKEWWDGHCWVWARGPDQREDWVPDAWVVPSQGGAVAARDYSARELDVVEDETLEVVEATHGWSWCRRTDGSEGWVPDRNLIPC